MDYRLQIARRYLVSRRRISLISIITGISVVGVTLGVAALIVVLSVMNGFYDFVRDLLVSVDPHVRVVSVEEGGMGEYERLLSEAQALPQVTYAAPYVEGKALLVAQGQADANQVVVVRGVDASRPDSALTRRTEYGQFKVGSSGGMPGAVVDLRLARQIGLVPGNDVRTGTRMGLLSAPSIEQSLTQVFGGSPVQRFEVRGLIAIQSAANQNRVFVGLDAAQRLFQMDERVSGIDLRLDNLNRANAVKQALEARIDTDRFRVQTWYDLHRSLYDVMQLEKWGALAILGLIVLVAAFNIVGSLTMVVIEKHRDIGVLQAMGVSRRNIRRIFLLEGALVGIVGTGLGVTLGLGLALAQKHFGLVPMAQAESFLIDAYPVAIRTLDVVLVAGVALSLSALAAIYPASRAAAIQPARAVQVDM
jgi:lipoprotein-releasing system permease protein